MPYLEQQSLYDGLAEVQKTNVRPWYSNAPSVWPMSVRDKPVATFLCPSDGKGGLTKASPASDPSLPATQAVNLPVSNYLGIFSGLNDGDAWNEVWNPSAVDPMHQAVFGVGRRQSHARRQPDRARVDFLLPHRPDARHGCRRGNRQRPVLDSRRPRAGRRSEPGRDPRLEKTGRKIPDPYGGPGQMMDETVEAVPQQYNAKSTLVREVEPGKNPFDFELTTQ